ncbi:MAG: hypothetical protein R2778_16045 [Saprospiraceae bacterium]
MKFIFQSKCRNSVLREAVRYAAPEVDGLAVEGVDKALQFGAE